MELRHQNQQISDLQSRIKELLVFQDQASQCSVLQLQIQQKDIQIQSQTKIISELQQELSKPRNCDDSSLSMIKIQLQQMQGHIEDKNRYIQKLETDLAMCRSDVSAEVTNTPIVSGDGNCAGIQVENNKLRAELHWQKVHAVEFENKYHTLVKENRELYTKLQDCVAHCSSKLNSTMVVGVSKF